MTRPLSCWRAGASAILPDGLDRFADIVLAAAAGAVGLVKPQSAFYERHGWRGIRTLQRLVASARDAGLLVILDVKRGDVGSTNDAYAEAYLGKGAPLAADAITVHPYLGLAAMGTFVSRAAESGSCLLVVTRSSNPEGRAVQAARADGGASTVEQALLRQIRELNDAACAGRRRPGRRRDRAGAHRPENSTLPPRTRCSWHPESVPRARPRPTWRQCSPPAPTASCRARPGPLLAAGPDVSPAAGRRRRTRRRVPLGPARLTVPG